MRLLDGDAPKDLSGVTDVTLVMRGRDRFALTAPMTVQDTPGVVAYQWQAGNAAVAGEYRAEVQVTWPGASARHGRPTGS